jgi:hypothetical protein
MASSPPCQTWCQRARLVLTSSPPQSAPLTATLQDIRKHLGTPVTLSFDQHCDITFSQDDFESGQWAIH